MFPEKLPFLIKHNQERLSHKVLEFKFLNADDHIVRQRSKAFYEKTLRFLR